MQLMIFSNDKPTIKPLLILRGTGKQILFRERLKYDKQVAVQFQPNALCEEEVMEQLVGDRGSRT